MEINLFSLVVNVKIPLNTPPRGRPSAPLTGSEIAKRGEALAKAGAKLGT